MSEVKQRLVNLCSRDLIVNIGGTSSSIPRHPTPVRVTVESYGNNLSEFCPIGDVAWPVFVAHYEPYIVWPDDLWNAEPVGLYVIVDPEVAVCVQRTNTDDKPLFSVWTPVVDVVTRDDGPLTVTGFYKVH